MNPFVLWLRTNPRNIWLIAFLVIAVCLLAFAYFQGRGDQAKREQARDAVAVANAIDNNARAQGRADAALEHAAERRAETERRLTDAITDIPDTLPDLHAVRLGCQRLCEAGERVADLPACRAVARRPEASADRRDRDQRGSQCAVQYRR